MAAPAGVLSDVLWEFLCGGLLVLAVGALPLWPWTRLWGYLPSAGLLLLSLLVLLLHANYVI